jgi:hypothetical protein
MNVQSLATTQSIQVRLNLKDDTSINFFGFIEHIVETMVDTALKHIVEVYDKVMPETVKVISKSEIGPKREVEASVLQVVTCLVIRLTHLSQKGALAELSHACMPRSCFRSTVNPHRYRFRGTSGNV